MYDVVVLGATGFTGQLAAAYLARQYPTGGTVKWALAGRSAQKLGRLCEELKVKCDTLECDVQDADAVEHAVKSARVVANFAGTPFADKAALVVEACARNGRHYVDITGEICLHRASYDTCHETCKQTGSIILHGCGYDSVPSDIGSYMAAEAMSREFDCKCSKITCISGKSKGAVSGGTLATGLSMASSKAKAFPGMNEVGRLGMCYALDPPYGKKGPDTDNHGGAPIHYHKVCICACSFALT